MIPLSDQRAATIALNEQRKRLGLEVWELEMKSGVSASAFFAWKSPARSATPARSPSFLSMVAIAETLGFVTIMRNDAGKQYQVGSARAAMGYLHEERRARGWTMEDAEVASGVSAATFYPIAGGRRDPRMSTMVAIAAALGFELLLRGRDGAL